MLKLLFLPVLLCVSAGSGSADIASPPRRIISLVPSVTESLCQLGAAGSIIGTTLYCPPVEGAQTVGSLIAPDIEKMVMLSPDLVIAHKENNRKATVETLRKLGITVLVLEPEKSFEGICANFLVLGRYTGREAKAREIIARVNGRLDLARRRARQRRRLRVFWEIGARPLFTAGRDTFVNDYHAPTNTENIIGERLRGYSRISGEEVVRLDPDVIILATMGDVTAGETAYWQQFTTMKAVAKNRILVVEASEILTPNPLRFAAAVEYLLTIMDEQR